MPSSAPSSDRTALRATPARPSRRALLVSAATATGLALQTRTAEAATTDPVLHLLRRATYGPTPALVQEVRASGTAAWLAGQLDPASVADPVADQLMMRWPLRNLKTWEVREQVPSLQRSDFMYGTVERNLARALWSKRQLLELVVDFWTNHLVVPVPSPDVYDSAHLYQRDVIRKHALGRYADMLRAAVRHPALLSVLDNASSTKAAPNENHARELLELHTVGQSGYTEADVKATAKVLTGLGIDQESGLYEFKPWRHQTGRVQVLDWSSDNTTPEGGEVVAMSLLDYLSSHPRTARRVATKLAVRFVADEPPTTLIDKLAAVYLSSGTSTAKVLQTLFASAEFAASTGQKVRTPYEDVVATLRIAGAEPETTGTAELRNLIYTLKLMGQAPMGWPAPDGYPDVAARWAGASGTLRRWNFHLGVLGGWAAKGFPRPAPRALLPGTLPATYGAYVDALAARLLVTPLTTAQRAALCAYLLHGPEDPLLPTDAAVTSRISFVAALLLDSPNFALR